MRNYFARMDQTLKILKNLEKVFENFQKISKEKCMLVAYFSNDLTNCVNSRIWTKNANCSEIWRNLRKFSNNFLGKLLQTHLHIFPKKLRYYAFIFLKFGRKTQLY